MNTDAEILAGIDKAVEAGVAHRIESSADLADALEIDLDDVLAEQAQTQAIAAAATQRQVDFATTLGKEVAERELTPEQANMLERLRGIWGQAVADRTMMSGLIESLLALKKVSRPAARATTTPVAEVPEGMHRTADDEIYKVQRAVHGSGNLYAKKLIKMGEGGFHYGFRFEYAAGAIRYLSAQTKMPPEAAAEFGQTYGRCINCQRTLTDERSIAVGYGETCAVNNGWPWG